MLVALALAPVAAPGFAGRAAAAPPAEGPPPAAAALPLRVGEVPSPAVAGPPLRYGDGPGLAVLRVQRDAPARIALDNRLGRSTSIDLHGLRIPAPFGGGGPLAGTVPPGTAAEIGFRAPDSGTFWFHPGILDPDRDETAAGLAGVLVVDEAAPPAVDADLVALLTDGTDPAAPSVDWGPAPRRETLRPGARVRLRLVNGSTRRAVTVACAGAETRVVAIDGQPSALFRPRRDAVPLGPGSRCDLVFDLGGAPGSEVRVLAGSGDAMAVVLVLRAEGEAVPPHGPVAPLPPNPALPEAIALERATRATLVAAASPGGPGRWTINGASGLVLPKGAPVPGEARRARGALPEERRRRDRRLPAPWLLLQAAARPRRRLAALLAGVAAGRARRHAPRRLRGRPARPLADRLADLRPGRRRPEDVVRGQLRSVRPNRSRITAGRASGRSSEIRPGPIRRPAVA